MTEDLFIRQTAQDKFWQWCLQKKLFSSVDISLYANSNYYLRAGRTCRSWCEPQEITGKPQKLERLSREEILRSGLWKSGSANIAWYKIR